MRDIADILKDWEPVIGLEIHTELTTLNTKMFCSCRLSHDDEPNTNVCPVCLGMPGALPVPNRAAIQSIVLAGLSTNCQIMKHSMFYRKNYFYPDMAKNFQTTQGPVAFCMGGWLDVEVGASGAKERLDDGEVERAKDGSYTAHIGITRIHMEEDAAKMVHVGGAEGRIGGADHSLIDYNRCGTPLIELVTEPDLRSPEEARLFMEKLRQIFLTIGISDCSMESGSMRCDGNISLRRRGTEKFGTRCEMKNLNSFKNLHDALEYEIRRQAEVLEEGGVVYQETRHWDVNARRTIVMRTKETADDYRLFPEPDMVPFDLSEEFVEEVRTRLPELPDQRRDRYVEAYGLKRAASIKKVENPVVPMRRSLPATPSFPRSSTRLLPARRASSPSRWPTSSSTSSWATSTPRATASPARPSPLPRSGAWPSFSPATPSLPTRAARSSHSWPPLATTLRTSSTSAVCAR